MKHLELLMIDLIQSASLNAIEADHHIGRYGIYCLGSACGSIMAYCYSLPLKKHYVEEGLHYFKTYFVYNRQSQLYAYQVEYLMRLRYDS